jgi:hypothetical protein
MVIESSGVANDRFVIDRKVCMRRRALSAISFRVGMTDFG